MKKFCAIILIVFLFVLLISCGNDDVDIIKCTNCGGENEITTKYCKSCGESILDENDNEEENDGNDVNVDVKGVKINFSYEQCVGKKCDDVVNTFKSLGFFNIKMYPIYDLVLGFLVSENEVERVSINDNEYYVQGELYSSEAVIKVYYHTWAKDEPQIVMPHASWWYDDMELTEVVNKLEDLGFMNFEIVEETPSDYFSEFYADDWVESVTSEEYWLGWSEGDVLGASEIIKIRYNPKSYYATKDDNSSVAKLYEPGITHEELGQMCCSMADSYIEVEGYVDTVLNQYLIWFILDDNLEDDIIGSKITIDIGYNNTHISEGQYLKLICKVDDTIASIAGYGGFDAEWVKFVE